jgi:hypothetical protein
MYIIEKFNAKINFYKFCAFVKKLYIGTEKYLLLRINDFFKKFTQNN